MPRVTFTQNVQRHLQLAPTQVAGATVQEALEQIFRGQPRARSYVLDDQGAVRKHVVIFVDGVQIHDPVRLSDPVSEHSNIYVMQALSGG
jgi:molybdopterin synthase sulfur carrier subunit